MTERNCWHHAEGEKGFTVTVYEREPGGLLYARVFNPRLAYGKGGYQRVSLKHRDKKRAKAYALEQASKLRQGEAEIAEERITLARLFALYETHKTPSKSRGQQTEDRRKIRMWTRVLGPSKDPRTISLGEWERFIHLRQAGAIDSHGLPIPPEERRPVRQRSVEADCDWLNAAFNWATRWRNSGGRYLLRENPVRGFIVPAELNVRRPVATQDRYEALRAVTDTVTMKTEWNGKRSVQRSYLTELLVIANYTGRRLSAIRQLRYEDLRLSTSDKTPYGAIRWPATTDKQRRERTVAIGPEVRAVLDRIRSERPGIGSAPLFPSPKDLTKPIRSELARRWLLEAEEKAKITKQDGSLFHAYRRKWATERKHEPPADVAEAGGWASTDTLIRCYQQPDDATILRVVLGGTELRELQAQ